MLPQTPTLLTVCALRLLVLTRLPFSPATLPNHPPVLACRHHLDTHLQPRTSRFIRPPTPRIPALVVPQSCPHCVLRHKHRYHRLPRSPRLQLLPPHPHAVLLLHPPVSLLALRAHRLAAQSARQLPCRTKLIQSVVKAYARGATTSNKRSRQQTNSSDKCHSRIQLPRATQNRP